MRSHWEQTAANAGAVDRSTWSWSLSGRWRTCVRSQVIERLAWQTQPSSKRSRAGTFRWDVEAVVVCHRRLACVGRAIAGRGEAHALIAGIP